MWRRRVCRCRRRVAIMSAMMVHRSWGRRWRSWCWHWSWSWWVLPWRVMGGARGRGAAGYIHEKSCCLTLRVAFAREVIKFLKNECCTISKVLPWREKKKIHSGACTNDTGGDRQMWVKMTELDRGAEQIRGGESATKSAGRWVATTQEMSSLEYSMLRVEMFVAFTLRT